FQARPEHLVHENRHGAECSAACPQDSSVETLEQLAGDVESDIRTRLEVCAHDADRNPALAHAETVRERPGRILRSEGLEARQCGRLSREQLQALLVELQSIARTFIEALAGRIDVRGVRREN